MIRNDSSSNSIYSLRSVLIVLLLALSATIQPADAQTQVVLGFTSAAGPSLAVFNNQLFMTYIGTDSNNTVNVARSSDPLHGWNQVQPGGNRSFDTPGIAAFNGKLYVAWVGTVGSGSQINIMSSTDGVNFSDQHLVGSSTPPPMASPWRRTTASSSWAGSVPTLRIRAISFPPPME